MRFMQNATYLDEAKQDGKGLIFKQVRVLGIQDTRKPSNTKRTVAREVGPLSVLERGGVLHLYKIKLETGFGVCEKVDSGGL